MSLATAVDCVSQQVSMRDFHVDMVLIIELLREGASSFREIRRQLHLSGSETRAHVTREHLTVLINQGRVICRSNDRYEIVD